MEGKDLRIGNYLQDYNERLVVVSKYTFLNLEEYQSNQNTALIPVPLTEEWLIKFGFGDYGYGRWELSHFGNDKVGRHTLKLIYSGNGSNADDEIERGLNYVHDLQNWVFGKTGLDLTIKE